MSLAGGGGSGEEGVPTVSDQDELYLVLEGRRQTHVATMKHSHDCVWLAPVPGNEKMTPFFWGGGGHFTPPHPSFNKVWEYIYIILFYVTIFPHAQKMSAELLCLFFFFFLNEAFIFNIHVNID